ncbi:protein adenylyltransferase SelO [Anaeromicropila herbilytica]|uniref:Protein nucleotidyltransferase YdiU n=1 Tax=Anaeromicropila herbilytica TaxID=2785025 RepID=A0A7R7IBS8_9FIRM|nr:YdiU family protein [Anaeromicropila herbilytica]BCN29106.1 UPF0061 protein [Anaeromicropila herbilytica]
MIEHLIKTESFSEDNNHNPGWNFDHSYAKLSSTFYTKLKPTPVKSPQLVKLNIPLALSLGLNPNQLQSQESIKEFAGNKIPQGANPLAQAYAGHQYGYFTMLGDGRAILYGEHITPKGERFDIQLKGSGETPYSRRGDGRAALGPMLREYIISEAMYALGIPTTRSLAVVTTGEKVIRENVLPGAILTRVAASHIRVGTFQYIAAAGSIEELRELADYSIKRHYPEIEWDENRYHNFLKKVIDRQAYLIARWQSVGFIHGVMNTDNMTISGETIDYGPCAFMDTYSPSTVLSSIDTHGRYAYGNQPDIGQWNLARSAETLVPLLSEKEEEGVRTANLALMGYEKAFHDYWLTNMRGKLGLYKQNSDDELLIQDLLRIMDKNQFDFTNTFRNLTLDKPKDSIINGVSEYGEWYDRWKVRLENQDKTKDEVHQMMRRNNPSVIPRNHRVEEALEAAVGGDYSVMDRLLEAISKPYDYTNDQEEYTTVPEKTDKCYRTFCGT